MRGKKCMSEIKYYCNDAGEPIVGRLEGFGYYDNTNQELYVRDDKRVLIGGGGHHYGESYAMEMLKAAMRERGYEQKTYTIEKTRDMFWIDELSSCYDIAPTNFLTYTDKTPRIEPSNLLMKLIGRI
jgi:hypothetical protein